MNNNIQNDLDLEVINNNDIQNDLDLEVQNNGIKRKTFRFINSKIDLDNVCKKALMFEKKKDEINIHIHYLGAIEYKYIKAYYLYGTWFKNYKKNQLKMIEYYTEAIELFESNDYYISDKKDTEAYIIKMIVLLAQYYDNICFPTPEINDNIIKYYEKGVKFGNVTSMYNLGHYYYECKNIEKMLKYYLMAIELKDIDTMYELALYYQTTKEYNLMCKYYEMAVKESFTINGPNNYVNDGIKYFDLFNLKDELDKILLKPIPVQIKLKEINNKKEIMIYNNKKKLFETLNNNIKCEICYEEGLNIDLVCGHLCCISCYPKLYNKPCPYCRL
jgi:tetratricopeptide (TPR) repeat protein